LLSKILHLRQRYKGFFTLGSQKATFMDKTPPFGELIWMDLILSCHRGDAVAWLFKLPPPWPFSVLQSIVFFFEPM